MVLEDGTRTRLVVAYDATRELMVSEHFSRTTASAERGARGPTLEWSVTEMDPPQHTRVRALLARSYSARGVERLRGRIAELAAELAGDMVTAGAPADLVSCFCAPLTFAAQCELLGIPERHRGRLHAWCVASSGPPGTAPATARMAEIALHRVVGEILEELRDVPGDALYHRLIDARDRSGLIDEPELHGIAASMFRDGHFLAATQIANSVLYLFDHPELRAILRERPALLRPAVEELLRLCPAVNHSMSRVALQQTELGGVIVPAGTTVTASLPAANRDGYAFARPDVLDLERPGRRHLSFGRGVHFCLGAHLARVEIHTGLQTLFERLPGLRLAIPRSELRPFVTQGALGVLEMPVQW
ncbi:MAG TPA: cytochrome P450 [Solirubrobacteraceae bacterium]|nr:cytochrome P450 [Solirubrobacteraceae bacterium]